MCPRGWESYLSASRPSGLPPDGRPADSVLRSRPDMRQYLRPVVAGLLLFAAACHPGFQLTRYTTNEALYAASVAQFTHHRWDDAIAGFEKLSVNLSARDTLLPRSFWYLARSYQEQREHILAAQTFSRLFTSFPDDSLAAAAALRTAREYRALWPKPDLDPQYGGTALAGHSDRTQLHSPPPSRR